MKASTFEQIKKDSVRRAEANQCTKDNPMPNQPDSLWYHVGARRKNGQPLLQKPGDSCIYSCPNCGHEFEVTVRSGPCLHN